MLPEPPEAKAEALYRVMRHKEAIVRANPCAKPEVVEEALRCAMTRLITGGMRSHRHAHFQGHPHPQSLLRSTYHTIAPSHPFSQPTPLWQST